MRAHAGGKALALLTLNAADQIGGNCFAITNLGIEFDQPEDIGGQSMSFFLTVAILFLAAFPSALGADKCADILAQENVMLVQVNEQRGERSLR